jgi:tetrapyrrole methylase family protein/MazG family protein/ATP diphosphatase
MKTGKTGPAETPPLRRLRDIMATLRDPQHGCPWDREQTFASLVPHTLEEAYEVAAAIEQDHLDDLRDELGDLLFQVVFYARLAEERGLFDLDDVATGICTKLERRHPHVFGNSKVEDAAAQSAAWESLKAEERQARNPESGILDGVATSLPALTRAAKLQRRAARAGFDWPSVGPVLDKMMEELDELRVELDSGGSDTRRRDEVGDLLFVCVNLARHVGVDPEQALRGSNRKFERRFHYIESELSRRGVDIAEASLSQMDALWDEAKAGETESTKAGNDGRRDDG